MPYREPIFYSGGYYHVFSRGSEKRTIFLDKADKKRFLDRLEDYKDLHKVTIVAYCLMPNHYHLLIRQTTDEPISKFINRLNLAYAMYFNKRYERVGPLFQGRFKAKLVENDEYLVHLSRYIHLNPLHFVGVESLGKYSWSSMKDYISDSKSELVDTESIAGFFAKENWMVEYRKFVEEEASGKLKSEIEELMFESIPAQVRVLNGAGNE